MRLLSIPVLLGAATLLQAQALFTVDDDLIGADFATIQAAVDAAPEGATILVAQGAYHAFSVVDRALVVTTDQGGIASVFGASSVTDLAPGKTLVLRGLAFTNNNVPGALAIEGCAGTVWIEDVSIESTGFPLGAGSATLRIEDSQVVLSRSTIQGMDSHSPALLPPTAFQASGSDVQLFETQVAGGRGGHDLSGSGAGGVALSLDGGFLFAASSTIQGGQGGQAGTTLFGCDGQTSGTGGAGLVLAGGAEVHLLGGMQAGGAGGVALGSCTVGPAGPASEIVAGTLEAVAWPAHGFAVESPVRESESATATFRGPPGEFAWYLFSDTTQALFLPQVLGTLVLDFPLFLVPVGVLDAQGEAQVALTPALAPGAPSQRFLLQSLFLDGTSGAFTLSSPASLVVLADGS